MAGSTVKLSYFEFKMPVITNKVWWFDHRPWRQTMDETSSGALKLKMDTCDVSATSGPWVGDASERPRVIDQSCTFLYSVTPNVVGAVFCQFFFFWWTALHLLSTLHLFSWTTVSQTLSQILLKKHLPQHTQRKESGDLRLSLKLCQTQQHQRGSCSPKKKLEMKMTVLIE